MRQQHYQSFQDMASRYAAIIGRKRDVNVSFSGFAKTGSTDGKHVTVPALPAGTMMTEFQRLAYLGYLDHEVGHILFTDFSIWPKERKLRHLTNLFEDIFIENKMIADRPGARGTLDALTKMLDQQMHEERMARLAKGEVLSLAERFGELLYRECYGKYRNIDTGFVEGWLDDYPEFKPVADLLRQHMPKITHTRDSIALAHAVMATTPQLEWNGPADVNPEDEKDPKVIKPKIILIVPGAPNGMPAGSMTPDDFLEMVLVAMDRHDGKQEILEDIIIDISDLNDKLENVQVKNIKYKGGDKVLPPAAPSQDKIYVPSHKDFASYRNIRNRIAPQLLATKKMLNMYLRSRDQRAWSKGLEEGRLDEELLHEVQVTNNVRVMKERRHRFLVNTALELLVDLSGSMNQGLVQMVALLLAEATNGIQQLNVSIAGFRSDYSRTYHSQKGAAGRLDRMDILQFKGFDEPYSSARDRLGAIRTGGGTPLGCAYGYALEHIVKRDEPRRVLWVLSDGEPAVSQGSPSHNEIMAMQKIHRKAKRLGIETYGMHIGDDCGEALKASCDKFAMVYDVKDVPQAILSTLRDLI